MKIFLFSHIADCDGVTPVILSKLAFKEVDYELVERDIDNALLNFIKEGKDKEYDQIFITDLCISKEIAEQIPDRMKDKIHIFDHHKSNLNMNEYSFIQVVVENGKILESGTSLYYYYLCQHYRNKKLLNKATSELVELVRLLDTWQWEKENVVAAKWLGGLLSILGKEEYINYFYNYLQEHDTFQYEDKLRYLLEVEDRKIEDYILAKEKEIIPIKLQNHPVGVVFAEQYRSIVGKSLAKKYQDIYDFIVIINLSRSISYRAVKEEIDVDKIASYYGGHGHKLASGSPLPKNIKEMVIHTIFEDAIVEVQK